MDQRTPRSSALTRVSRTVEALARALFAGSDRNARTCGWDVTVTGRWGTSRAYHDPRYDRLATCVACAGHGCSRCAGTGRITHSGHRTRAGSPAVSAERRRLRDDRGDVAAVSSSDRLEPTWHEPRIGAGADWPARPRWNQDAGGIGWDRSRR